MKYRMIEEDNIVWSSQETLYRIQALRDFADVRRGDLGGYIAKESNLSQHGLAWVSDYAQAHGNSLVSGDATLCGNARIFDEAEVLGHACVCGDAWVFRDAQVSGRAWVCDHARVCGRSRVFGSASVSGSACVINEAQVYGYATIQDDAVVMDGASVYGEAVVRDAARVGGTVPVRGETVLGLDSEVRSVTDYMTFGPINGLDVRVTCAKSSKKGEILVFTQEFSGTLEDFFSPERHGKSGRDGESRWPGFVEAIRFQLGACQETFC